MDSIRTLQGTLTPISAETALTYQFYLNRKYFQEEAKLEGLSLISEKRFLKLIKNNLHSKIVVESNNQIDLDKLSKLMKQSPDSEFILLHTGSPYLNFPTHSKLTVILSFSPTKASQTALIRRVFQSSPDEKVLPCNLNLKIKK
jgi:beta-N-acetylhexosaminidase